MKIDRPKPQNAAPEIHPRFVLFRWKSVSKSPMMSPRMAKDIAVAMSAMQLAVKSRPLFMVTSTLSDVARGGLLRTRRDRLHWRD